MSCTSSDRLSQCESRKQLLDRLRINTSIMRSKLHNFYKLTQNRVHISNNPSLNLFGQGRGLRGAQQRRGDITVEWGDGEWWRAGTSRTAWRLVNFMCEAPSDSVKQTHWDTLEYISATNDGQWLSLVKSLNTAETFKHVYLCQKPRHTLLSAIQTI